MMKISQFSLLSQRFYQFRENVLNFFITLCMRPSYIIQFRPFLWYIGYGFRERVPNRKSNVSPISGKCFLITPQLLVKVHTHWTYMMAICFWKATKLLSFWLLSVAKQYRKSLELSNWCFWLVSVVYQF